MIWPVDGPPAGPCHPAAFETLRLPARAGDGNRTRMTSLEGWGSTIELRPHNLPASVARLRAPAHQAAVTGSVPVPLRRPHPVPPLPAA